MGLTAVDLNNGTNISLYVYDSSDNEKKTALKNIADGMGKTAMAYINVDMYSISSQGTVKVIRTTYTPVTMVFGVPNSYINPARAYSVICIGENGKPVVFHDMDKDDKTITVASNVFGAYMIVY